LPHALLNELRDTKHLKFPTINHTTTSFGCRTRDDCGAFVSDSARDDRFPRFALLPSTAAWGLRFCACGRWPLLSDPVTGFLFNIFISTPDIFARWLLAFAVMCGCFDCDRFAEARELAAAPLPAIGVQTVGETLALETLHITIQEC